MDLRAPHEPLAIIGVGCRFPGARDLQSFEELLFSGRCAIGPLPPERFDQALYYDPQPGAYGKSYCRLGGCIEDAPFDAGSLGLPGAVAESRDRAHLWALDVARATLEHARLRPADLAGTNAAVVLGHSRGSMVTADTAFAMAAEELLEVLDAVPSSSLMSPEERAALRERILLDLRARYPRSAAWDGSPGSITSAVAGVVSAALGLTGRHMVVDAACASSLAALQIASRALRQRRVDLALVGGVSFSQTTSVVFFAQSRALSAEGSFPFDARANGFISSDGVGMLLLERMEDARARGHAVHAVLRGVGGSCDGRGKGLWAPRKEGQVLAMQRALERAGVDAGAVGFVEAHGTSTALGDATEIAALAEVLGPRLPPGRSIPVGSVKGNIGHCREAAGVAGLIKAVIALKRGRIPPSVGYERPHPDVRWETIPLHVAAREEPWPPAAGPRVALVDSFGIGGLNYQVVVEEAPPGAQSRERSAPPRRSPEPVAIVGMGALFPGAPSVAELWRMLREGRTAIGEVPPSRWSADVYHRAGPPSPWRTYARRGGFIQDFAPDWRRHRMPPSVAAGIDPLQFMLLEAAEAALADAGLDLERVDRRYVSVVIGSGFGNDYALLLSIALRVGELGVALAKAMAGTSLWPLAGRLREEVEQAIRERLPRINEDSSGSFSSSTLASRIAKTLDLGGPALALDAACASSLAALETACESLADGDCDLVLCGGGDRSLRAQRFETLSAARSLSAAGRCAPFEAEADGFLPAEGAGLFVLERLSDALSAGRRVHAVVSGVGSASEGRWQDPYAAAPRAMLLALRRAYESSGVPPSRVAFVEAHGDGTPERDRAEADALRAVFAVPGRSGPLPVGSVKANIGHAQGAAGAASLLKASLCLGNREVPAQPGSPPPAPLLGEELELLGRAQPLPAASPAAAGVSAMGLGGVSYHAVLETAPPSACLPARDDRGARAREPVVIRGETRLELAGRLASLPSEIVAALASGHTYGAGPVAVALPPPPELRERLEAARIALRAPVPGGAFLGPGFAVLEGERAEGLAFLFPGQGSQYEGMLREVVGAYPEAARVLREMDALLVRRGHAPLSRVIWEEPQRMGETLWAQLAVLGGGLLMAEVAAAHGLTPGLVTGHSYGDYPALVAAGALSLEQALDLTLVRCDAIAEAGVPGRMAAVFAGRERLSPLLAGLPGFAAESNVNGPGQVVVSGEAEAVEALLERCRLEGIEARALPVPGAFHSPLMGPAAGLFAERIRGFAPGVPRIRFLSSVTGTELSAPGEIKQALVAQLTVPVDFVAQMEAASAAGFRRFLEVGPGSTLCRLASAILGPRALAASLDERKRPGVVAVERALLLLRASEVGEGPPIETPALRPEVRFFDATEARRRRLAGGEPEAPRRETAASPSPAPPAGSQEEEVRAFLLERVIELTGYPPDLVAFDVDMEADLGIDTVKQAQVFGRMRERFDLRTDESVSLRDFPTLDHVLRYVAARLREGAGGAASPPPAVEALPESPAPEKGAATLALLRLAGTPFEMGLEHGRRQREAIRRLVGAYEEFLGRERLSRDALQQALARPEEFLDGEALEEVRGLAEGTGLPERHLIAYNLDAALFSEYGPLDEAGPGCVQAGLFAGALHAANEDSPLALFLRGALSRVAQVRTPVRGHPHVLFSFPGQVGGLNGANAAGLVATSCVLLDHARPAAAPAPGLLHGVLVRKVLQEAGEADAALSLARGLPRGSSRVDLQACKLEYSIVSPK